MQKKLSNLDMGKDWHFHRCPQEINTVNLIKIRKSLRITENNWEYELRETDSTPLEKWTKNGRIRYRLSQNYKREKGIFRAYLILSIQKFDRMRFNHKIDRLMFNQIFKIKLPKTQQNSQESRLGRQIKIRIWRFQGGEQKERLQTIRTHVWHVWSILVKSEISKRVRLSKMPNLFKMMTTL